MVDERSATVVIQNDSGRAAVARLSGTCITGPSYASGTERIVAITEPQNKTIGCGPQETTRFSVDLALQPGCNDVSIKALLPNSGRLSYGADPRHLVAQVTNLAVSLATK